MTVDPDISRHIMQEELEAMAPLAASYGWDVVPDLENLTVSAEMKSAVDGQIYVVEARCDGYKALPPFFEFIHPEDGERGTHRCYPAGGTFFHSTPCICVQWNRKAYQDVGGPHSDWKMADWMTSRPGTTTLGDMFHLIQREINNTSQYRGRMG